MPSSRRAVVLVLDRLGAAALGPYANTWIDTPAFNRLAAESLLLEFASADGPDLPAAYQAYWRGRHGLAPPVAAGPWLFEELRAAGAAATVLTDEPWLAAWTPAQAADELVALPAFAADRPAAAAEETHLFRFFAAAHEMLERAPPGLLWLHARALSGPWDAPLPLRNQFADEDDPLASVETAPPSFVTPPDCDPDLLWSFAQAHAGQVALLDACLEGFLDAWRGQPWAADSLLAALAPRGYPLGEHGALGDAATWPHAERTHVPWLLCQPGRTPGGWRGDFLAQSPDLWATLRDWWRLPAPPARPSGQSLSAQSLLPLWNDQPLARQQAAVNCEPVCALRVPSWLGIVGPTTRRLYAKPDDRFEVNDLAARYQPTMDALEQALEAYRAALADPAADAPPLPEALRTAWV